MQMTPWSDGQVSVSVSEVTAVACSAASRFLHKLKPAGNGHTVSNVDRVSLKTLTIQYAYIDCLFTTLYIYSIGVAWGWCMGCRYTPGRHFTVRRFLCYFLRCIVILHLCCIIVTWWCGPGNIEA